MGQPKKAGRRGPGTLKRVGKRKLPASGREIFWGRIGPVILYTLCLTFNLKLLLFDSVFGCHLPSPNHEHKCVGLCGDIWKVGPYMVNTPWGSRPYGGGWSGAGADTTDGTGKERVKGSVSRIGSQLSEGSKISMSPPICSGLTLNVNHSITMSLLISTGRGLNPENWGWNLSLKQGKWDGSGAQNPSCLQIRHKGLQAGQPPSSIPAFWVAGSRASVSSFKKKIHKFIGVTLVNNII